MKNSLKVLTVFLFLSLLVICKPTPSLAWYGGGWGGGWHGRGYVGVNIGVWPGAYYYGGPYYNYYDAPYYYSPEYVDVSPSYQPVVVNGITYYLNNGVYYVYTQDGYQAVATPAGVKAPVAEAPSVTVVPGSDNGGDNTFTINIPNAKGGFTSVIIKKSGNGYLGPQGEFYSDFPKVSQLEAMYGK